MLHALHAGSAGLVLVLQVPLLLQQQGPATASVHASVLEHCAWCVLLAIHEVLHFGWQMEALQSSNDKREPGRLGGSKKGKNQVTEIHHGD